ncbi:MAG: S41 family peptidase [Thermomicrobiales bacterium]|nr:S41 family peptidase [Thermomicrobiales bacterium]
MSNVLPFGRSLKKLGYGVAIVGTLFVGAGMDRVLVEVGEASDRFSNASNYSVIGETYDAIRENYVLQDEFTDEQLVWGAASGMVDTLGDTNHSVFLTPSEALRVTQGLDGSFVGVGINYNMVDGLPVINYPLKNSPAMEAGVLPGDTLIMVDGIDLRDPNVDVQETLDMIRGEEGTPVTLTLIHQGETEPYEITVNRARLDEDPVEYAMLPDGTLWLHLSRFSSGSSKRLVAGLEWGKEQGMTGVILDLRGNGGGYVNEARVIIGQFLPPGTPMLQELDAAGNIETTTTAVKNGAYLDGPLVVLVDSRSASASEITASALQETGRAEVVGITTAGTGTVLLPFEMSDGSMALLGIQLFLTGQGNDIYHVGVVPDHEVALSANPLDYPRFPALLLIEGEKLDQAAFDVLEDPQLHQAFVTLHS